MKNDYNESSSQCTDSKFSGHDLRSVGTAE